MKKLLALIYWILMPVTLLMAQEDRLQLISSSHSRIDGATGHMVNYRPVYEHEGSTLSADSGYIYTDELKRDYFDAFGQVVITQPNGTLIYANKLNYAAETQLAILTGNVRLIDGNSVLTTNYLTYNMKSDIGTYTNGGRITNDTDTITSERAWYFNNTDDAYFRVDVIVRTPDVHIFTDTMRYNSESKTTFFYGPTNIKGKEGENLYTEEGYYNTETELAEFYKNNLYTEDSRLLRGDTLFYNGKSGDGRALSNVVFIDTADQFFAQGMIGLYNREDESILMTDRALITLVVNEESDPVDSVQADSLTYRQPLDPDPPGKVDSVYLTADTLFSKMILRKDYEPMEFDLDREGGAIDEGNPTLDFGPPDSTDFVMANESIEPEKRQLDSLHTDSLQLEQLNTDSLKSDSLALEAIPDSTAAIPIQKTDYEDMIRSDLEADSALRKEAVIPKGGEVDSLLMQAAIAMAKPQPPDVVPSDSLASDTARTRIVKAYRNMRLYKSDLQVVADSAYYGYADSMMRFFGSPMAWTQGSQLSGDSLFLQIKNEEIDNMVVIRNAFIVNTQQDSSKFNQVKGRKITGFFTNGDLDRIFVDGNAENIAYRENETKTGYTDMYHNRSARIKILIKDNELTDFIPIKSTEGTIYPLSLVKQEQEILDGFIWKPDDRPTSKEDLLTRKRVITQPDIPSDQADRTDQDSVPPPDNDPDP